MGTEFSHKIFCDNHIIPFISTATSWKNWARKNSCIFRIILHTCVTKSKTLVNRVMIERWLPTYGDGVASVVEQFAERRATFSSPRLLAVDSVEGLVEKESKRAQKVTPPRRLEG